MTAVLVIMAKQPQPGEVKTRLAPVYGEKGAAAIAEFLLAETVSNAGQYWPGDIILSVAPDCQHGSVQQICDQHDLACYQQCDGDLGIRMQHEIDRVIRRNQYAVVIGTDAPHALEQALPLAWQAALEGKTVIAPSSDGGYYLLGMNQVNTAFFSNIPWGSSEVYALTREVLEKDKTDYVELPQAIDIDTAEDLQQAASQYRPLQQYI